MSQHIEGPRKTFTAGEALPAFRRVLVFAVTGEHGPTVKLADATEPCIGVTEEYTASGAPVTIYLANAQGTRKMMVRSGSTIRSKIFPVLYLGFSSIKGMQDSATSCTACKNSGSCPLRWRTVSMNASIWA